MAKSVKQYCKLCATCQRIKARTTKPPKHLRPHNQPSKKFQQRYIGPYKIISKISNAAFELDLPATMQCHNVFHINKLRPCSITDVQPDYIPVAIEKERQDFIVDHIVEHDIASARDGFYERGPCLVFKVRWAGYDESADTLRLGIKYRLIIDI